MFVSRLEDGFSNEQRANKEWFPKYLHVMVPRGGNVPVPVNAQWQGILHAVLNSITTGVNRLSNDIRERIPVSYTHLTLPTKA